MIISSKGNVGLSGLPLDIMAESTTAIRAIYSALQREDPDLAGVYLSYLKDFLEVVDTEEFCDEEKTPGDTSDVEEPSNLGELISWMLGF